MVARSRGLGKIAGPGIDGAPQLVAGSLPTRLQALGGGTQSRAPCLPRYLREYSGGLEINKWLTFCRLSARMTFSPDACAVKFRLRIP
jgi:hypothetical protein